MDFSKHSNDFSFLINNTYVGEIIYYKIKKTVTQNGNNQDVKKYILEIKKRFDGDSDRIHSDYFADMPFTAAVIRYGEKLKFPLLKIIEVTEQLEEDRCIYQTIIAEGSEYLLERVSTSG